jgi:hypothetical protein
MSQHVTITPTKRPWTSYLLWAVWLVLLAAIAQNAIASAQELETQAATIFWITFAVVFIAGLVVAIVRRNR